MKMRKDERGQSIVEFALVLPMLMMILLGILAFGDVYANYLEANNHIRTSSRILSLSRTKQDAINSLNSLLDSEYKNVTYTFSPDYNTYGEGDIVTIKITYSDDIIFPLFNSVDLSISTVVGIE
jgi:Flp pilus assembly protein TadG